MKIRMLSSLLFTALLIVSGEVSLALTQGWSGKVCWHIAEPSTPSLSLEKEAAKTATTIATTISTVAMHPTTITHGTRAYSILQMVSCGSGEDVDEQSWLDNPISLSIGGDELSHHTGAIVGNWIVLGGVTAIWKGVAIYFKDKNTMFPGGLIVPIAFLFAPTTTSSMLLVSQGTAGQRFVGVSSLGGQIVGLGTVIVFLLPRNFHADLIKEEWIDKEKFPGYVKHFGLLFDDYRPERQWFIGTELLMSSTTGFLKSYQIIGADCITLLTFSAVNSIAYATSIIFLHPHRERKDKIFYGAVAGLQATAISVQAIASWAGDTALEKVRPVTEAVIMATEWALLLRSVYDIYGRAKDFYQYFVKGYFNTPGTSPNAPLISPPNSDAGDTFMLEALHRVGSSSANNLQRTSNTRSDDVFAELLGMDQPEASPIAQGPVNTEPSQRDPFWRDPDHPNPLERVDSMKCRWDLL